MGQQIIKQPNGKYCLFSSIVDSVTYYNMTKEEIIEVLTSYERKKIEEKVNEIVGELDKGNKPYLQFTIDYKSMLKRIKEVYNGAEMKRVKNAIENEQTKPSKSSNSKS